MDASLAQSNLSQTIANVTVALAPAFATGFAVQQALQIIDPLISKDGAAKQAITGMISLTLGLLIAGFGDVLVIGPLVKAAGSSITVKSWIDMPVSALIISAGTEGFNSIMKFLSYQKEAAKSDAALKKADAASKPLPQGKGALGLVNG